MAEKGGDFREELKDILVHRDELESHFQSALELANTKEELVKLLAASKKIEKYSKGIQEDIIQKLNEIEPTTSTGSRSDQTPLTSSAGPKATTNGSDQVTSVKKNDSQISLGNVAHSSQSNSSFGRLAGSGSIQDNSEKQDARLSYFVAPADTVQNGALNGQPQQQRRPLTNSGSEYSTPLSKNDHAPDSLKVFLPNIGILSEAQVSFYFERFGHVQDIIRTAYPFKPPTAIVRFIRPESVKQVLETPRHMIDGHAVYPKAFNSTYAGAKQRAESKQAPLLHFPYQHQVYVGGIPTQASVEQVKDALLEHTCGDIKDIKMPNLPTGKHRGFAFVHFERNDDANYICSKHFIFICGRQVECKPNTRPHPSGTKSGFNMTSLADSLPNVPSVPNGHGAPTAPAQTATPSALAKNGENPEKCIICKAKPQNCIMLWCGHTSTCMDCGKQLSNCPKANCNEPVDRTMEA